MPNDEHLLQLRRRYLEIDSRLEHELATLEEQRKAACAQAQIEKDLAWSRVKLADWQPGVAA